MCGGLIKGQIGPNKGQKRPNWYAEEIKSLPHLYGLVFYKEIVKLFFFLFGHIFLAKKDHRLTLQRPKKAKVLF